MSQMIYKADCENCVCKCCCEDVGKERDCVYFTKYESEVQKYLGNNYDCRNIDSKPHIIKEYLRQRHEQEVIYAKETLRDYGKVIALIALVVYLISVVLYWHVVPLRVSFMVMLCIATMVGLYCAFKPAFLALRTIVRKR